MENLRILCPACNLSRKRRFSFDELLQFAEGRGNSPRFTATISKLPPESNPIQSLSESLSSSESMIADDDAREIQKDHNRLLDAAEDAGFKMSNDVRATLIALYADHGLAKVLGGLKSCVEHGAPNLAYLKAVLKGKPKQVKPAVIAQDYEQRDYSGVQDDMMANLAAEMLKYKEENAG